MLDLKNLLDGSVSVVNFSLSVTDCEFIDPSVTGTAVASGSVTNHSGVIVLTGEIIPALTAVCGRCGVSFNYNLPVKLSAKITDKLANDDEEEFVLLTDNRLDVDELVRSALILELPSRFLCKEDCKGLCPKCGCDLNHTQCSCDMADRDPRWDVLKDYFGD